MACEDVMSHVLKISVVVFVLTFCASEKSHKGQKKEVVVISAGDIFLHKMILKAHGNGRNRFEFKSCFELVRPYLSTADFATAWFEGALDRNPPYTGYPRFKSPAEIATAVKDAGIDILLPSNHVLDLGNEGLMRTIAILDSLGILHPGAYLSEEESKKILIVEKDSIKIAFLSYTYGTNNLPIPQPFMVNLIDSIEMKNDIFRAKKIADFIVVALHFGKQYQRQPDKFQKEVARQVAGYGADLIVGSHCHVVQPAELIEVKEDGLVKKVFVEYCVGNFLCNQRAKYRDIGIMLRYVIEKDFDKDSTYLKEIRYIPIWISRLRMKKAIRYKIVPVMRAINKWEKGEWRDVIKKHDYKRLKNELMAIENHIDDSVIGLTVFAEPGSTAADKLMK